jgi:putative two-component system response regulator
MKVLVAEDNHFYRLALKATISGWGYDVIDVDDGGKAWDILAAPDAPKIAILDWLMPIHNGIELCQKVRSLHRPEPPYLIILTSLDGKEHALSALRAGADDFIHKPFDREQLQARLQVAKRIVGLQTSQTLVFTFARAVEAKSPFTQGHAGRVTHYALALAAALGLSETDRETLRRGGLLHDIGKISIPDAILNKPGPLTPEEFEVIKQHPSLGEEIVKPLQSLQDTLPLIRWHHERRDGQGYPDGLRGDDIPLIVRVLSVADTYDAISSDRPYRPAILHEPCLRIMFKDAAEGGLDPELVQEFSALEWDRIKIVAPRTDPLQSRISDSSPLLLTGS